MCALKNDFYFSNRNDADSKLLKIQDECTVLGDVLILTVLDFEST